MEWTWFCKSSRHKSKATRNSSFSRKRLSKTPEIKSSFVTSWNANYSLLLLIDFSYILRCVFKEVLFYCRMLFMRALVFPGWIRCYEDSMIEPPCPRIRCFDGVAFWLREIRDYLTEFWGQIRLELPITLPPAPIRVLICMPSMSLRLVTSSSVKL